MDKGTKNEMDCSEQTMSQLRTMNNLLKKQLQNIHVKFDSSKSLHYISARISNVLKITLKLYEPGSAENLPTFAEDNQFEHLSMKLQLFFLQALKDNNLARFQCHHCNLIFTGDDILSRIGYHEPDDIQQQIDLHAAKYAECGATSTQ